MAVPGRRVNAARPVLVRHMQIDALPEQHRGALGMPIQRRDMHQRAAILCPLVDTGPELIRQQLDHVGVSVLGRQMHRRPVLVVRNGRRRAYTVKVLDQTFVALSGCNVEGCLAVSVLRVDVCAVVHEDPHHLHVATTSGQVESRVAILRGGLQEEREEME